MKSRRLTIFCVALVALAGTPRAWQEAGKLLAAVQHKAQVRFWSMVLQPKTRESANVELVASIQPARLDADCPLEPQTPQSNRALSNSKAGRKVVSASSQSQRRAPRQNMGGGAPLSHAGLIATALEAPRGESKVESLRHSGSIPVASSLSRAAESYAALLALNSTVAATAPLPPPASKSDTFKYVLLPTVNPAVSVLVEKENVLRFKMLRKAVEEPKMIRQKNRPPVIRGAAAAFLPGS